VTRIHIVPRKETAWSKRRIPKLEAIGCTEDEVEQLKWNRMTNPRVAEYLNMVRDEVRRLRDKYNLPSYAAAAKYRREHRDELIDAGDIQEPAPYRRMGYY
jgi:hypothetical protein